jgi:hypothetical protein
MILKHLRWKLWWEVKLLPRRTALEKFRKNNPALEEAIRRNPALEFLDQQLKKWDDIRRRQNEDRRQEVEKFMVAHKDDPLTPKEKFLDALYQVDSNKPETIQRVRNIAREIAEEQAQGVIRINGRRT